MSSPAYLRRRAASAYLRETWGLPCSEKTLAKLACLGGGPVFRRYGRMPVYTAADLDAYAKGRLSGPVCSTSEYPGPQSQR